MDESNIQRAHKSRRFECPQPEKQPCMLHFKSNWRKEMEIHLTHHFHQRRTEISSRYLKKGVSFICNSVWGERGTILHTHHRVNCPRGVG
jgi:hypothetical protein